MTASESDVEVNARLYDAIVDGTLPKELLICGPAGTGKTYSILQTLHVLASDWPDLRILFCRQTRTALTQSVCVTFEQEVLPSDGAEEIALGANRRTRQSYAYPNGSEIVLGGLDRPDRVLSTAWDIIYINEATEVDEAAWDTLSSRLNRPGRPEGFGYLLADTNPGDPSHWLKTRATSGRLALWDTTHKANPGLHDGTDWTPAGIAYRERLERLTGTRRKRLLEGLWAAGEGQWFEGFGDAHVSESAEFDPFLPVHLSVDCGVHTGAVLWQPRGEGDDASVSVFADYYNARSPAFDNALTIKAILSERCGGRFDVGRMDPAGNSDNGTGTVIRNEYLRAGLDLKPWPKYPGCVASGLALVDSFVSVAPPRLTVHPRCKALIDAFHNYKRKKRGGQWVDEPEDPQHPHEDVMDALRSGLLDKFPAGRAKPKPFRRPVHPHNYMY